MIKLTQLYNEIRIASPTELPDITDKLTETGFRFFTDTVLYDFEAYDYVNEKINGDYQNEFYPNELSKFYKEFSKDDLLFEDYYSQMLGNLYGVDMNLFNQIEDGLYRINKEGYRQGYIEIFPGMKGKTTQYDQAFRIMRMYVVPEITPNKVDEPDTKPQPIFTVTKGFRVMPVMSEDELAEKLESNSRIPGMWYII